MNVAKISIQVPSPIAGDDGEAVLSGLQTEVIAKPQLLDIPVDAGWYVAVVRCNCEAAIAEIIKSDLSSNDTWFEYWVPMQKITYLDKRSRKRKVKEKVLLSTFIFCHVSKQHLNDIRFRSDVYKMLTMPGHREIYRIRDKEFNDYRQLVENQITPITPCTGPLKKGQKVRIIEGNMAGLEAYVQRLSGKKAVIGNEIKYISGATIEIDRALLETIPDE